MSTTGAPSMFPGSEALKSWLRLPTFFAVRRVSDVLLPACVESPPFWRLLYAPRAPWARADADSAEPGALLVFRSGRE